LFIFQLVPIQNEAVMSLGPLVGDDQVHPTLGHRV
jgi:hypothetical protein